MINKYLDRIHILEEEGLSPLPLTMAHTALAFRDVYIPEVTSCVSPIVHEKVRQKLKMSVWLA